MMPVIFPSFRNGLPAVNAAPIAEGVTWRKKLVQVTDWSNIHN